MSFLRCFSRMDAGSFAPLPIAFLYQVTRAHLALAGEESGQALNLEV